MTEGLLQANLAEIREHVSELDEIIGGKGKYEVTAVANSFSVLFASMFLLAKNLRQTKDHEAWEEAGKGLAALIKETKQSSVKAFLNVCATFCGQPSRNKQTQGK